MVTGAASSGNHTGTCYQGSIQFPVYGVAVGALLYTGFHPWNAFNALFSIMKDSMNLNILIFDVLLE